MHLQSGASIQETGGEEDEEVDIEAEEEEDVNIEREDEDEVDIEGGEAGGVDSEGGGFGSMPTEEQLPGMQRSKPDRYAKHSCGISHHHDCCTKSEASCKPVDLTHTLMHVCTCCLSRCKAALLVTWQTQVMQAAFCDMLCRMDAWVCNATLAMPAGAACT